MLIGLFHRLLVGFRVGRSFRVRRSYRFRGRLVNYLIIMVVLGRRGRNSLAFSNNFSPTRSVWFHDLLPFLFLVFFTFRIRLELVVSAPFDCEQEHGSTFELSIKSTILPSLVLNSFMSRTSTSAIISVCLFRAIVRESVFSDRLTSRDLGTRTVSLESSSSSATSTKLFVTSSTVVPSAPSSSSSTSVESLVNFNSESTPILCFLEKASVLVSPATLTIMAAAAPSGRALQLHSCLLSLLYKTLVTSLLLVKILCLGVMKG